MHQCCIYSEGHDNGSVSRLLNCDVQKRSLVLHHTSPSNILRKCQQCTEVSTLLWVQELQKNCAHVCNQAITYTSETDVQILIRYLQTTCRYNACMVSKIIQYAMSRVSVHKSAALNCVVNIMLCIVYSQKTKVSSYSCMLPCYQAWLTSIFTHLALISMVFTFCSAHVSVV